ncbi:MAG: antibiotic biosynthesis monooxygenase [Acidobacteriota bacterium]|nr:antibiotic biosynthesis monooxygenase [Acidobacteriota bacterium]MDE3043448.1 antibiotic biosynthesis monooxygenase [Acidobacteriota bacterium]MDE3107025.1 antibiotic biosynthesis monooxygenase [Acidobacteriota bacterium]MDE3223645.1 antibiotic biosynthesis monooxygenase [Acidobacteriota bacterium]
MVLEHAVLTTRPGEGATFEANLAAALAIIESAEGCLGAEVRRQIEDPTVYLLLVRWTSVEAHLAFRETERFTQWRALTWPHYASAPHVTHFGEPLR